MLALAACGRKDNAPTLFELLRPDFTGVTFVNELPERRRLQHPQLPLLLQRRRRRRWRRRRRRPARSLLHLEPRLQQALSQQRATTSSRTSRCGPASPTQSAGRQASRWRTSMATDALDIYVSAVDYLTMHGRNVLYINNGERHLHRQDEGIRARLRRAIRRRPCSSTTTATATWTCSFSITPTHTERIIGSAAPHRKPESTRGRPPVPERRRPLY